jgi:hypothetical protein
MLFGIAVRFSASLNGAGAKMTKSRPRSTARFVTSPLNNSLDAYAQAFNRQQTTDYPKSVTN